MVFGVVLGSLRDIKKDKGKIFKKDFGISWKILLDLLLNRSNKNNCVGNDCLVLGILLI